MSEMLSYDPESQRIWVRFDQGNPEYLREVKKIPTSVYDEELGCWFIEKKHIRETARTFPCFDQTEAFSRLVENARIIDGTNTALNINLDGIRVFGKPLFDHQKKGIKRCAYQRKAILAFDPGCGKTLTSLFAAKILGFPTVVVGPVFLRRNWLREAKEAGIEITYYSYAALKAPKGQFTLIADESHSYRNIGSKRTKLFLEVAEQATAVFCLTGTPIPNGKTMNLFPMLRATKHYLASSKVYFEMSYPEVTRQLHEETKDLIIYQSKEECLDLPPKLRTLVELDLEGEALKTYEGVMEALRSRYRASSGLSMPQALQLLMAARRASSWAKLGWLESTLEELNEAGKKAVVFSSFKDIVAEAGKIASKFGKAITITGDQSEKERDRLIKEFQESKDIKTLIATYGSVGIGYTMTAASYGILMDRPYVPGEAIQGEDRLHRIGTKGTVSIYWPQVSKIDRRIDEIIQRKHKSSNLLVTGVASGLEFINEYELAQALLKEEFSEGKAS